MGFIEDIRNLRWGDWLRSLLSAGISAAATTLAANPIMAVAGAPQLTPRQLLIFALSSAVVAMAGVLQKSPLPDRAVAIALISGVHTEAEVKKVLSATAPGTVPDVKTTAAILGKTVAPDGITVTDTAITAKIAAIKPAGGTP